MPHFIGYTESQLYHLILALSSLARVTDKIISFCRVAGASKAV